MARRTLRVDVNSGAKRCKGCAFTATTVEPICGLFGDECDLDAKGRPLRLGRCHAAEGLDGDLAIRCEKAASGLRSVVDGGSLLYVASARDAIDALDAAAAALRGMP